MLLLSPLKEQPPRVPCHGGLRSVSPGARITLVLLRDNTGLDLVAVTIGGLSASSQSLGGTLSSSEVDCPLLSCCESLPATSAHAPSHTRGKPWKALPLALHWNMKVSCEHCSYPTVRNTRLVVLATSSCMSKVCPEYLNKGPSIF